MKECPETFFFGSAGWGGGYFIGVHKAMEELWGDKLLTKKYYGISAGCIMGMYILLGYNNKAIEKEYIDMSNEAKKIGSYLNASYFHDKRFQKFILKDDYKKLNGKLFIGLTSFYGDFILMSEWKSNKELIDTLHAAIHIPYYSGNYINKIRNKTYIDGGLAFTDFNFLPNKTLKIGVWDKDFYDIKLVPALNFTNSRQPNLNYYYWIKEKGYKQLVDWDEKFVINKYTIKKYRKHLKLATAWLLRSTEYFIYKY